MTGKYKHTKTHRKTSLHRKTCPFVDNRREPSMPANPESTNTQHEFTILDIRGLDVVTEITMAVLNSLSPVAIARLIHKNKAVLVYDHRPYINTISILHPGVIHIIIVQCSNKAISHHSCASKFGPLRCNAF